MLNQDKPVAVELHFQSIFEMRLCPSLRGLLIAMLVSLLFLLLLRFTAPVMVWVLIFGVLAAGAYGRSKVDTVNSLSQCSDRKRGLIYWK